MKRLITYLICMPLMAFTQVDSTFDFYEEFEYENTHWNPDYEVFSQEPYGGFIMVELLDWSYGVEWLYQPVAESFDDYYYEDGGYVYLFYGFDVHYRERDFDAILDFVETGNTAIYIAEHLPFHLERKFFDEPRSSDAQLILEIDYKDSLGFWQDYDIQYLSNFKPKWYEFREISSDGIRVDFVDDMEILAYSNNKITCVKLQYGSGQIIFHSVPMAFSNYWIKHPAGKEYVLNFFNGYKDKTFLIDNFSNSPVVIYEPIEGESPFEEQRSPLSYVLSTPSLSWAYWILLALGILYILFRLKRRQPIIPLIDKDKNSSLEFVETVSQLYMNSRKHQVLVKQKRLIFMDFVKTRYYIHVPESDKGFFDLLATKSGIERGVIDRIFERFDKGKTGTPFSTKELIALHADIEHFYSNCN